MLVSSPTCSKRTVPFTYSEPKLACSILSHACYMPHLIILDPPNKIWHKVEIIKLIMMQCAANRSEYIRNISGGLHKIAKSDYYLLTAWCRVLLEKLIGLQLVKKFPAFHGTRRFITALTSVRHLSLS